VVDGFVVTLAGSACRSLPYPLQILSHTLQCPHVVRLAVGFGASERVGLDSTSAAARHDPRYAGHLAQTDARLAASICRSCIAAKSRGGRTRHSVDLLVCCFTGTLVKPECRTNHYRSGRVHCNLFPILFLCGPSSASA